MSDAADLFADPVLSRGADHPGYACVSPFVTKLLRRRLNGKYERGAANNVHLVEGVSGLQTVKTAAMAGARGTLAAGNSASNQRVINPGNTGSQALQRISKQAQESRLMRRRKKILPIAHRMHAMDHRKKPDY